MKHIYTHRSVYMNMYTYMIYRSVYETQRDGEREREIY